MQPILIGHEKAALESLVKTGKTTVPVLGKLDHLDDGTMRRRTIEIDASDSQIREAKRRLAREEQRRKRVEAERKERERLRQRAEAHVPEAKALREAEERLANARAELTTLKASAPSIAERAQEARQALLEAEATHAVGDLTKAALAKRQEESERAQSVADSMERDLERSRLIVSKMEAKVQQAKEDAERKAEVLRSTHVQAVRTKLAEAIEAAGDLERLERELKTVLPNLRSRVDENALRRIKAWAEALSDA